MTSPTETLTECMDLAGLSDLVRDSKVMCPVRGCRALVTKGIYGNAYVCESGHAERDIVLAVAVAMDSQDSPLGADPYAPLKKLVMDSLVMPPEPISSVNIAAAANEPRSPSWPTGLDGDSVLQALRGVTILSGESGAGKTWMALCSGIDAANSGWKVVYLAAEMAAGDVSRRVLSVCDGKPLPAAFKLHTIDFGVDIEGTVGLIAQEIDKRPMLVVVDSLSSFVDQSTYTSAVDDPHAIGPLKKFVMWALNVRRRTRGRVSFLLLSELNAAGVTKGRFADYKADISIYLKRYEESEVDAARVVRIKKNWDGQDGSAGVFFLRSTNGRLTFVSKEPEGNSCSNTRFA